MLLLEYNVDTITGSIPGVFFVDILTKRVKSQFITSKSSVRTWPNQHSLVSLTLCLCVLKLKKRARAEWERPGTPENRGNRGFAGYLGTQVGYFFYENWTALLDMCSLFDKLF